MERCGLSVADFNTYVTHLRSPSIGVQVHARLLDMNMGVLETMPGVVGGTLNVDTTQPGNPSRNATVILSDPGHTMNWDSNSPSSAAVDATRQVRLDHVTYVPALGRRVTCPLITGPVRGFSRNGTEVTLTIAGRDGLLLGQAWRTRTYNKGRLVTDVIKDMLGFYGGNVNLAGIPALSNRLPQPLSISKTTVPWTALESLSSSIDRHLYFDGAGHAQLRTHPVHSSLALYEGDQGVNASDILGEATASWQLQSGWYNTVEVMGATPNIHAVAYPPPSHPMHPQNMGGNGAWYVELYQEQNGNIRTTADAQARANRLLAQQLAQQVNVTAISKVFPFMHELDVERLQLKSGAVNYVMETFSIDLAGTGMSHGFNKRMHAVKVPRITHKITGPKPPPHHATKGKKK